MAAWVLIVTIWGSGSSSTPAIAQAPMDTEHACRVAADQVKAWSAQAYALCLKTKD